MSTYFGFSDECGDYQPNMGSKSLWKHPFYLRTTLLLNSREWKQLNIAFKSLKDKHGISHSKELKWADLWSLRHYQQNGKSIPIKHQLKYFETFDYHDLVDFVEESLALINSLSDKKIILSYTQNKPNRSTNEKAMLGMHLQEHMQRIEMELQKNDDNLGVLFFDPVNPQKNEFFRELYYELFEVGDYIEKYSHIKDSLNIENSHHSVGIQLADYISGAFSAVLKSGDKTDYSRGVKMFFESVYPNLRRSSSGKIQGYGIREVPSSGLVRGWLNSQLAELKK